MYAHQSRSGRGFANALLAIAGLVVCSGTVKGQLVVVNQTFTGTTAPGWTLGGTGFTPVLTAAQGIDPNGSGWLRLTSSAGNESTYAYNSTAFAATSDGVGTTIAAKFSYASYNGSGADGITFFLAAAPANGSTFTPGAYGGSLGYAQKTLAGGGEANIPGMSGGYIGLGIDEFGNYAGATEGRIGGVGTTLAGYPNEISVRGPGSGYNGYEYLGGTGALGTQLAFPTSTTRPTGNNARTFEITISATNQLTVYMQVGAGPMTSLYSIDLSGYARPDNLIMGFTGSTGGATDIHEIQGLSLTSMAARLWTNNGGTSTWGSSSNWNGSSGVIPTTGADVLFDNTFVSSAQAINVNQNRVVRAVMFDAPFSYTLSNGSLEFGDQGVLGPSGIFVSQIHGSATQTINSNLSLDNSIEIKNGSAGTLNLTGAIATGTSTTAPNAILLEGAGNTSISGAISGTASLTKNDSGNVSLSGNNSGYTGATTLNAGTLTLDSNNALGTGTSAVSLYGGTLASSNGSSTNRNLTLLGDAGLSNLSTTGTLTQSGANRTLTMSGATQTGAVNLSNNNTGRTLTVEVDSGVSTISGVIQNGGTAAGNLTKTGDGVLTLGGVNTFTGTTSVNAGTLRLGNNDRLATNPLVLAGGTLDLNNFSEKVGTLTFSNGGTIDFGTGTNGNTFVFGTLSTNSTGILTIQNWDSTVDVLASTQRGISTTLLNSIYFAGYGSGSVEDGGTSDTGNGEGYAYHINPNSTFLSWSGGSNANNNWSTGANWAGGVAPSTSTTSTQKLNFTGTTRLGPSMDRSYSANSLRFDPNAGAFSITLNANTLTLRGNVPSIIQQSDFDQAITSGTIIFSAGTNGVVDVSGAGRLTIGSALSGSGNINKLSSGTLALAGNNSAFSGAIHVSEGLLQVSGYNSVLGTGATAVDSGATLRIADGRTLANSITVSGVGLNNAGALDVAAGAGNTATLSTALTLGGDSTIQVESGTLALGAGVTGTDHALTMTGAGNATVTGALALGTAGVTFNGTGTTTFTGAANSYTGLTTVNSGTLVLNKAAGVTSVAGDLAISGGTVNLAASGQIASSSALTMTTGAFALQNGSSNTLTTVNTSTGSNIGLSAGSTLTVNGTGVSTINGTVSGAGALNTVGTGTVVLANTNTYSGGTSMIGVVAAMASGSLGTGAVSIGAGGNLQVQNNITLANTLTLNSAGTNASDGAIESVSGSNVISGAVNLTGNSRIQTDSGTLTLSNTVGVGTNTFTIGGQADTAISGIISGAGNLTKNGTGSLLLSGANTLSGNIEIDAGKITLGASNVLADASTLVLKGGTLAVGGSFSDTAANLLLQANSTIDFGKNTSTLTFGNVSRTGGTLTIDNWAGNPFGAGSSQLLFSNSPTGFTGGTVLNEISFTGYGSGAIRLAGGEIVPNTGGGIYVWALSTGGTWDTTTNWTPNGTPHGIGDTAILSNSTGSASTIDLHGADRTLGYLTIDSTKSYLVSGATNNLIFDVNAGSAQLINNNTGSSTISAGIRLNDAFAITQNGTGNLIVSGGISSAAAQNITVLVNDTDGNPATGTVALNGAIATGAGSLTKNGGGTLTLGGANTYTGGTTINGGTLAIGADNNLGGTSGALSINGGTLENTASMSLSATRSVTAGAAGATFLTDSGTTITYNGVLTGSGTINKTGAGTFTTGGAGANTNTGALNINAGTFEITKSANVSAIDDNAAVTIANGGTLRFNGAAAAYGSETIGSLDGAAGSTVNNASLNVLTLAVGANGASSTFAGTIQNSGAALSLTKRVPAR